MRARKNYRPEYTFDLQDGNWGGVDAGAIIPSQGETTTYTHTAPEPGETQRFYRAIVEP